MAILDDTFGEWTVGLDSLSARINIFEKIRDIPYAIIPEIIDFKRYVDILKIGRGSCSPKHFLLCEMFTRLGLNVLYVVYPHQWEITEDVTGECLIEIRKLAEILPVSHHIACKVEIDGELRLIDVTLDAPLQKAGFPVNIEWDGRSDTVLPVVPCGAEDIYHPSEAPLMEAVTDERFIPFYNAYNAFLERIRRL